jgi:murein DD-endopeptidase MepM/ murein hydrolase activator NlpD
MTVASPLLQRVYIAWTILVVVVVAGSEEALGGQSSGWIPEELLGSFGSYPNLLQVTDDDRQSFHPVLKFPKYDTPIPVLDYRNAKGLASLEQIQRAKQWSWWKKLTRPLQQLIARGWIRNQKSKNNHYYYGIGRYDENRIAMYCSELFQNTGNEIDGFGGQRTVHLGIDLGGPCGTKVYAFDDGVVHSVGYNPEYGDYGHVIVIQHTLPSGVQIWALYGHLDQSTLVRRRRRIRAGMTVKKGAVIGRLGDCHENGGWEAPHVHFQLSMSPPETHDMPGASSVEDRPKALLQYPDPRLILGPIY